MCESPKVSETCFVHLCIASAGNQVKRPLPEARTKEDGKPGKRWNCDSSSRSFRARQELEGLRWLRLCCITSDYENMLVRPSWLSVEHVGQIPVRDLVPQP